MLVYGPWLKQRCRNQVSETNHLRPLYLDFDFVGLLIGMTRFSTGLGLGRSVHHLYYYNLQVQVGQIKTSWSDTHAAK